MGIFDPRKRPVNFRVCFQAVDQDDFTDRVLFVVYVYVSMPLRISATSSVSLLSADVLCAMVVPLRRLI